MESSSSLEAAQHPQHLFHIFEDVFYALLCQDSILSLPFAVTLTQSRQREPFILRLRYQLQALRFLDFRINLQCIISHPLHY
jgi:hypothetical protein